MAALAFLAIGVVCALISRVLLFTAAWRISGGWAAGVLLPFGPMVFRLKYPEEARSSWMFRLVTLPCFGLYFFLGPGPSLNQHPVSDKTHATPHPAGYALEKAAALFRKAPGPTVELSPSPEERRQTNTREFERLRAWNDALRLKKRDLLHSDTAGNEAYLLELGEYNSALQRANAERAALWPHAH